MIFKKDNFLMGIIMGLIAPLLGIVIFKMSKLRVYFKETFQFMILEPGYKTLTVALSLSLLLNALLFTIYINSHKDKTAKGIFATTVSIWLAGIARIKTFL